MSPEAAQLRANNNLAALPPKDRDRCSWMVNAGLDDLQRRLQDMTGTPADVRVLEVAYDLEMASAAPRSSRLKPIAAKMRRFGQSLSMNSASAPSTTVVEVLSPESLLESTELTTVESTGLAAVESAWTEARRLAGLVKDYSRATTAAKTLCGIRLRAIREFHFGPRDPKGGRPKENPTRVGFGTWGVMLDEQLGGVDERTAERWMKMADAVEALAEAKGLDLQSICEKLPWDWTPEEAAALDATVHKLTEDKTQRQLLQSDFLASLGYEAPGKEKGTAPAAAAGKKKPASSAKELLRERQEAARLLFLGTAVAGRVEKGSVAMFMEHFTNTGGSEMEALPEAELRDLYEHTVKPFAAAFRKLSGL